jgi:hypothetical protein
MMPKIAVMLFFIAGVVFFSCNSPTAGKQDLNSVTVQGTWEDHLDPSVLYFAGATHTLAFYNDSFFLRIHEFTDAIATNDSCASFSFTSFISGTFSVSSGGNLTLDGTYVDSLKKPMPACGCAYGPRQSGRYLVSFKGSLEGSTLSLTPQENLNMAEWVLKKE